MTIENTFGWIGWCHEDNHDKIYGYFYRPSPEYDAEIQSRGYSYRGRNICRFWGRRGKAMQFKADVAGYELDTLIRNKQKKYTTITDQRLFEIWPTFITEAEEKLMWDVLAGKVK